MNGFLRLGLIVAGLGGLIWLTAVAGLLLYRHDLIYPFRGWADARQVVGVPGASAKSFTAADGTEILYWRAPARADRPTILHFTGNAGSLASSAPRLREMVLQGYGIVALNYRGAGGAPGRPGEAALVADALALYDRELTAPPVIWGTSLGAALAVQIAARRPAHALIAETPFARLCEAAEHHYPLVPACLILPDNHWDSLAVIAEVKAPVLILHGDADRVIPLAQAQRLFEAAPEPRTLLVYPGGRHNDLRLYNAGADILRFLRAVEKHADG